MIEGEEMAMRIAEHVVKVTEHLGIPYRTEQPVQSAQLDIFE